MKYSTNYNMDLPEISEQYDIKHMNKNTEIIDAEMKKFQDLFDNLYKNVYPVGCLYWSSKPTDPSTFFTGTKWKQIKDKFVFAQGSKTVDSEGGHETITLSIAQLPSHNHTISHTHTMAHTHSISHTHSYTPSGSVSSSFTGSRTATENESGHTHGMSHQHSFNGSHTHQHKIQTGTGYDTDVVGFVREGEICLIGGLFERKGGSGRWTSYSNKYGHDYLSKEIVTIKGTTTGGRDTTDGGSAHNHYFTAKGTVSSTFTGTQATIGSMNTSTSGGASNSTTSAPSNANSGNTGSGSAINIMPPYVVKYCWERIS